MHSVGSLPHNSEVDVPLNYADYYFLEALKRKRDLEIDARNENLVVPFHSYVVQHLLPGVNLMDIRASGLNSIKI